MPLTKQDLKDIGNVIDGKLDKFGKTIDVKLDTLGKVFDVKLEAQTRNIFDRMDSKFAAAKTESEAHLEKRLAENQQEILEAISQAVFLPLTQLEKRITALESVVKAKA